MPAVKGQEEEPGPRVINTTSPALKSFKALKGQFTIYSPSIITNLYGLLSLSFSIIPNNVDLKMSSLKNGINIIIKVVLAQQTQNVRQTFTYGSHLVIFWEPNKNVLGTYAYWEC